MRSWVNRSDTKSYLFSIVFFMKGIEVILSAGILPCFLPRAKTVWLSGTLSVEHDREQCFFWLQGLGDFWNLFYSDSYSFTFPLIRALWLCSYDFSSLGERHRKSVFCILLGLCGVQMSYQAITQTHRLPWLELHGKPVTAELKDGNLFCFTLGK